MMTRTTIKPQSTSKDSMPEMLNILTIHAISAHVQPTILQCTSIRVLPYIMCVPNFQQAASQSVSFGSNTLWCKQ